MNKSDCCNAEARKTTMLNGTPLYECKKCKKEYFKKLINPKVTKYYQVTYWKSKDENKECLNDIVIADNPVRAMEIVTSGVGCKFEGIKLIEIIQEDNQDL